MCHCAEKLVFRKKCNIQKIKRGCVRVAFCKIEPKTVVLLKLIVPDLNFLLKKNKSAKSCHGKALFIALGTKLLRRWAAVFS